MPLVVGINDVINKVSMCGKNVETHFFCSLLVKSEPTWLHTEFDF